MRIAHHTLPSVETLLKNKKHTHHMWHPKGAYVYIAADKVNQYKVALKVDLWNISYDLTPMAADAFRSRYHAYLDWLTLKERKGTGKTFYSGIGKTHNTIQVMMPEADEWMKQLWELCSDERNLVSIEQEPFSSL